MKKPFQEKYCLAQPCHNILVKINRGDEGAQFCRGKTKKRKIRGMQENKK